MATFTQILEFVVEHACLDPFALANATSANTITRRSPRLRQKYMDVLEELTLRMQVKVSRLRSRANMLYNIAERYETIADEYEALIEELA